MCKTPPSPLSPSIKKKAIESVLARNAGADTVTWLKQNLKTNKGESNLATLKEEILIILKDGVGEFTSVPHTI